MTTTPGVLYLCATPIGNLEDMTYRAVRVLKEVAAIAAEDTRHTRKLLSHFDIHTPLVSYHEHNKAVRGPELIDRLLHGEDIALVSDAGMPGISDPGLDLTRQAINAGITVTPVPGANAALAALVCSGLDTTLFIFVGFLPKARKKRKELIASLISQPYTLILYEAPHRLKETLAELQAVFGDRQAVAARELTKKFEEFVRGTLASLQAHFTANAPRGEFALLIEGNTTIMAEQPDENNTELSLQEAVMKLVATGIQKKDAIRLVASQRGLPRREVYQLMLDKQ